MHVYFILTPNAKSPAVTNHTIKYRVIKYLLTKLSVPLARSTSPPVGLTSSPTNPFPVPLSKPTAPSFWRPNIQIIVYVN